MHASASQQRVLLGWTNDEGFAQEPIENWDPTLDDAICAMILKTRAIVGLRLEAQLGIAKCETLHEKAAGAPPP